MFWMRSIKRCAFKAMPVVANSVISVLQQWGYHPTPCLTPLLVLNVPDKAEFHLMRIF